MLQDEHLLVKRSVIVSAGSDTHHGSSSNVWELDLKCKSVEHFI